MSSEFDVFCMNKYIREKKIDVSNITDPVKLDSVFNGIKSSDSFLQFCKNLNQQDQEFIDKQNYDRYSFWSDEEPKENVYTFDAHMD